MTDLTLVASCGSFSPTCAGGAHPGVFQLSNTGTGAAGTNCAGLTFAIAETNSATGPVRFTRTDGFPIVLGRADIACDLDTCRIQFSISNLKMPTVDSYPTLDEAQTVRHANGSTGSDQGEDVTTIVAGSTTTTTTTTTAPAPSTTIKPSTTTTTTQPPPTKDRPRKPPRPPK